LIIGFVYYIYVFYRLGYGIVGFPFILKLRITGTIITDIMLWSI